MTRSVDQMRATVAAMPTEIFDEWTAADAWDDAEQVKADLQQALAGAAADPAPEGTYPTSAQLWRRLLEADVLARFEILDGLRTHAGRGYGCFEGNHAARIEDLQRRISELADQLRTAQEEQLRDFAVAATAIATLDAIATELDRDPTDPPDPTAAPRSEP